MVKKMTKLVTNNFGLKIMALLFAMILWLVVVNIDDPTVSKSFTTSVTIENDDAVTGLGKYYEVVDGSNTVTFRVSAKRSVFRAMSNTDFKAVADMSRIEDMKRVPIEITATRYASYITFSTKTQYLEVEVEDLQTKQLVISADYTGTPAENCAVGSVYVQESNVLKVSGPATVVSQIETARATINVEGMSTTISDNLVPVLYDAEGNVIDTTKLDFNMDTVNIVAEILDIKTVGVSAKITGTPADGFVNTSISYSPETVAVMGDATMLNAVNTIEIPEGIINIQDATDTITQTVDISSYLPVGVSITNNDDKKITVTVVIEKILSRTYEVPVENFTVISVPSGYEANFLNDTIDISVLGLETDLENLTVESIKGVIDASGLSEGDHSAEIQIELDESLYQLDGTQTAILSITEKNADTGTTDNTQGSQTGTDDTEDAGGADSSNQDSGTDSSGEDDSGTIEELDTESSRTSSSRN